MLQQHLVRLISFSSCYWLLILLFCLFQPQIHHDTAVKLSPSSISGELSLHALYLLRWTRHFHGPFTQLCRYLPILLPSASHYLFVSFGKIFCSLLFTAWRAKLITTISLCMDGVLLRRRHCRHLNCCQRSWLRAWRSGSTRIILHSGTGADGSTSYQAGEARNNIWRHDSSSSSSSSSLFCISLCRSPRYYQYKRKSSYRLYSGSV